MYYKPKDSECKSNSSHDGEKAHPKVAPGKEASDFLLDDALNIW